MHPKKKKPVGERMALCARQYVYGESVLSDPPVGVRAEREGNKIRIFFENCGTGLHFCGDSENMLLINGVPYTQDRMEIMNDSLIVSLTNEERAETSFKIEFASGDYYKVNIYNSADIPAIPFICVTE